MPDFREEVRKLLVSLQIDPVREAGIVEEVAQHLEDRYKEHVTMGSSGEAAYATVVAELDQCDLLARELRRVEQQVRTDGVMPGDSSPGSFLAHLGQDLRYAVRTLRLNAGFSIVAILSLALGIGANTAIFQLLDAVRLRTLPVKNPNQLVEIGTPNLPGRTGHGSGDHQILSNPLWEQIRDHQQAFSGTLAWSNTAFDLAAGGQVRPARGMFVSGDFFNVLGVQPVLGRIFTARDDQHGCGSPGAVISHSFWQQQFGGNPSVIGSQLRLDGQLIEIIGVTPASFFGVDVGRGFDVAVPLCSEPLFLGEGSIFTRSDGWWLAAMGRLKPDWTAARATGQLESISPGVFQATLPPSYNPDEAKKYLGAKLGASPAGSGLSTLRTRYEDPLWLLLTIAGAVLLIVCANLANLMLARTSAREHEIAVRLALGASRFRLVQQLLSESLLLAVVGAAVGALLAQWLTRVLVSFLSTRFSQVFLDLSLDWRMLAFIAGLAVLTCTLFGLAPTLRATATPPASAMKAGTRSAEATRQRFSLRRALVITQVALSLTLVVGALLFVRTFQNLMTLDAGFERSGLLVAYLNMTSLKLPLLSRTPFKKDLLERVRAIPGVDSAAEASIVPATTQWWNDMVHSSASGHEVRAVSFFNAVSPGFFKTMSTELLQGRDISESDSRSSPPVAVVNQTFVRKFCPDTNPIGTTFRVDQGPGKPELSYEIAGIVKDAKYRNLREPMLPVAYLASAQAEDPDMGPALLVRSNLFLDALRSSLDRTIHDYNPAIEFQFSVLQTDIGDTLVRERLMASLSSFFGFLAVLLATIGLYGVISYMVARRRSEIGIRMALGADRGRVLALILREAVLLLGLGIAIGTALALLVAKSASGLLYGLKARDPGTFVMAAALLAAAALAASYLPARRAARLDPLEALREE